MLLMELQPDFPKTVARVLRRVEEVLVQRVEKGASNQEEQGKFKGKHEMQFSKAKDIAKSSRKS